MTLIIVIILLILCIYFLKKKEKYVSNRDYLAEVLLTGRNEIREPEIKYSGNPPSFKLSDNKISSD